MFWCVVQLRVWVRGMTEFKEKGKKKSVMLLNEVRCMFSPYLCCLNMNKHELCILFGVIQFYYSIIIQRCRKEDEEEIC